MSENNSGNSQHCIPQTFKISTRNWFFVATEPVEPITSPVHSSVWFFKLWSLLAQPVQTKDKTGYMHDKSLG